MNCIRWRYVEEQQHGLYPSPHTHFIQDLTAPSGKRYKVPKVLKNVYKHSFIPAAAECN